MWHQEGMKNDNKNPLCQYGWVEESKGREEHGDDEEDGEEPREGLLRAAASVSNRGGVRLGVPPSPLPPQYSSINNLDIFIIIVIFVRYLSSF